MTDPLQTMFAAAAIRHEQEGLREEIERLRELLREAEKIIGAAEMTDLLERLRYVETGVTRYDFEPISEKMTTTNWYRNPDGPEAADEIERLMDLLRREK